MPSPWQSKPSRHKLAGTVSEQHGGGGGEGGGVKSRGKVDDESWLLLNLLRTQRSGREAERQGLDFSTVSQAVVTRWGLQGGQSFKQPRHFNPTLPLFTSLRRTQDYVLSDFLSITISLRIPFLFCFSSTPVWFHVEKKKTKATLQNHTDSFLFFSCSHRLPHCHLSPSQLTANHRATVKEMHQPTLLYTLFPPLHLLYLATAKGALKTDLIFSFLHDGQHPPWHL